MRRGMGVNAEPRSLSVTGAGLASPMIEKARSALLPPQDVEDTVETLMVSWWGPGRERHCAVGQCF